MNKKGNVMNIGIFMVYLFVAALLFLIVTFSFGEYADRWRNNTIVNSSQAAVEAVDNVKGLADDRLDYITFILLIGFTLAIIITGYMIPANTIFAFIYFIALVLFVVTASILSFVWNKVTTQAIFANSGVLVHFPIGDFIMTYLPHYVAIVGFIGMIVMFAKPRA